MSEPETPPSPSSAPHANNDSGKGGSGPINIFAQGSHKTFPEGLLDWVKFYHYQGFNVISIQLDSKKPAVKSWKEWEEKPQQLDDVIALFTDKRGKPRAVNLAIICGNISGSLIVVDFDSEKAYLEFSSRLSLDQGVNLTEGKPCEDGFTRYYAWVVKTGKGFHLYLRPPSEIVEGLRTKPNPSLKVDIKANGGYVLAPPSIHPEKKTPYEFVVGPSHEDVKRFLELVEKGQKPQPLLLPITKEVWEKILAALPGALQVPQREAAQQVPQEQKEAPKQVPQQPARKLSESEILKVVELLKPAYKPGYRDFIVHYLSGWMKKANVEFESAKRVIELLAQGDEEFQARIYVLEWNYGLRGAPKDVEKLKGKSGLQEILEEILGEEKAIEIIRQLEEIFGVASPWLDSVVELLDYEKQLYAVANLRKKVIVRAVRAMDRLVYKERVFLGVPEKVVVVVDPFTNLRKFQVIWRADVAPRPVPLEGKVEEIVSVLVGEGFVYSQRLAKDVLAAILNAYIKKGKAEVRIEQDKPGFYYDHETKKIIAAQVEVRLPSVEEVREALDVLNQLAGWYSEEGKAKLATVLKWGLIAPFNFARKQKNNKWIPYLFLWGRSHTGKSTQGEMVLALWGLLSDNKRHRVSGAQATTPAQMGFVISQSTYPVLIDEAAPPLTNEATVEMLKAATEQTVARGRYRKEKYEIIPSLAPLILTSNVNLEKIDDALMRRLLILTFTHAERIDEKRAEEFNKTIRPQLSKLKALGDFAAYVIINNPQLLDKDDWLEIAETILGVAYKYAKMPQPEWTKLRHIKSLDEAMKEIYEDQVEAIRVFLLGKINEAYARAVGKITDGDLKERVEIVLRNRLLPWAWINGGEVVITTGIMRELGEIITDPGGLRGLAEMLGWEYAYVKTGGRGTRAIKTTLEELMRFLAPGEESP